MELYAGAALTGMGYLLNKQRDVLNVRPAAAAGSTPAAASARRPAAAPIGAPSEKPSMDNMYSSDYWNTIRKDEFARSSVMTAAAQSPFETGVVPKPAYASMFAPPTAAVQGAAMAADGVQTSSLSGQPIEQFLPAGTQPYFRGRVRQNTDPEANNTLLENYTANSGLFMKKQEVSCFFEPTTGFANICGMANYNDEHQARIEPPLRRHNDFPIEQVRVAPGLGLGFTAEGLGGFQQAATLDYIRPKTVDELRPGNRPKAGGVEGRATGASAGTFQRGIIGAVDKNRPDTFYKQSPDQWLKTRGANDKERMRPAVIPLKPTARVDGHVEYKGAAAAVASQPGKGTDDDYGKATVIVYDNERMTTQTRTVVSNLTSAVKAVIAPLLDIMKPSVKEYLVDAPRTFGNMQAQMPAKATVYDPVSQAMRTTIKETNIHNTTLNNLRAPTTAVPVAMETPSKTTGRETLPVHDSVRNVSSHTYRVVVYNPDAVAKTTHRETTTDSKNPAGFVGNNVAGTEGAYTHIPVHVPATSKQFLSDNEHIGAGAGKETDFRPMSHEAFDAHQVDGTREALNIAAGRTPGAGGAYVGLSADGVSMDVRKLVSDSLAPRGVGNAAPLVAATPIPLDGCEISKPAIGRENAAAGRLDASLMSGLNTNPYAISINPIADAAQAPRMPGA